MPICLDVFRQICRNLLVFGLLLMVAGPGITYAGQIEETLPSGLVVTANYHKGDPQKPAALILHGFLQVRDYMTVSALSNAVSELGYTVLTTTLSLGINKRKQSLQCDAVHMHTMEDDLAEIDFWVNWLSKRDISNIVLIGHSFGSIHNLAYTVSRQNKLVKYMIATSLISVTEDEARHGLQIKMARDKVSRNDSGLSGYTLSYCNNYVTPASAFLSYAIWGRETILQNLAKVTIPFSVILGSADRRIKPAWRKDLARYGAKIEIIKGADHFFGSEYEFDLMDRVQKLLEIHIANP